MVEEKFMQLAINKAREGMQKGQTPFGACIVKDNQLIVCEHNVVWDTTDITAHAEVNAIRQACKKLGTIDLSGCEIYSTCEPCPMCFAAIHWAGIRKIVFGSNIDDAEKIGFHELKITNEKMKQSGQSPMEIVANFMREEAVQLFDEFAQKPDKKIY